MPGLAEFDQMMDKVSRAINSIPRRAGALAVNFSTQRFRSQSWVDHTTDPWPKRKRSSWGKKQERPGRAILVKTGKLRRSIRVISVSPVRVVIGTDVPYARAHNDGFRGKVKQNVKAHSRTRFGMAQSSVIGTRKGTTRRVRMMDVKVKAHTRTIRQNLPRRRFIGTSAVLDKQLERMITVEIMRAVKNT